MKERKAAEFILPNQQEVFVSRTTTTRELGIKDTREKRLSLDIEPFTVFSIWDSQRETWTYLGLLDHPFVSSHLAHLLNAGAPVKLEPYQAKRGVLADFIMPKEAKHPVQDNPVSQAYVRLDKSHRSDPDVGPIYKDFVEYGLEQEYRALKYSKYDPIFDIAMEISFLKSQRIEQDFDQLVSGFREELNKGRRSDSFIAIDSIVRYSFSFREEFLKFYNEQQEREKGYSDRLFGDIWKFPYMNLNSYLQEAGIILKFLEQLDQEKQAQAINSSRGLGRKDFTRIINPGKKTDVGDEVQDGVKFCFDGSNLVELSDANGISIQLQVETDSNNLYLPCEVTKYTFPPEPLQSALYAVIAWENSNGKRRFISQKELLHYFPLLPIDQRKKPDRYLGTALLAYFSENITRDWEWEIPLKGRKYSQKMMAAQMVAWPSLDNKKYPHARQLLAGEVIQKLEQHALVSSQ